MGDDTYNGQMTGSVEVLPGESPDELFTEDLRRQFHREKPKLQPETISALSRLASRGSHQAKSLLDGLVPKAS